MKHTYAFVISEFTNPFGEFVFRLTGWLDGKPHGITVSQL